MYLGQIGKDPSQRSEKPREESEMIAELIALTAVAGSNGWACHFNKGDSLPAVLVGLRKYTVHSNHLDDGGIEGPWNIVLNDDVGIVAVSYITERFPNARPGKPKARVEVQTVAIDKLTLTIAETSLDTNGEPTSAHGTCVVI